MQEHNRNDRIPIFEAEILIGWFQKRAQVDHLFIPPFCCPHFRLYDGHTSFTGSEIQTASSWSISMNVRNIGLVCRLCDIWSKISIKDVSSPEHGDVQSRSLHGQMNAFLADWNCGSMTAKFLISQYWRRCPGLLGCQVCLCQTLDLWLQNSEFGCPHQSAQQIFEESEQQFCHPLDLFSQLLIPVLPGKNSHWCSMDCLSSAQRSSPAPVGFSQLVSVQPPSSVFFLTTASVLTRLSLRDLDAKHALAKSCKDWLCRSNLETFLSSVSYSKGLDFNGLTFSTTMALVPGILYAILSSSRRFACLFGVCSLLYRYMSWSLCFSCSMATRQLASKPARFFRYFILKSLATRSTSKSVPYSARCEHHVLCVLRLALSTEWSRRFRREGRHVSSDGSCKLSMTLRDPCSWDKCGGYRNDPKHSDLPVSPAGR